MLACVLGAACCLGASRDAQNEAIDASVRHLRTAVTVQRDGSHLAMLFSLRQLRDPSLAPLFRQLVQHPEWQVQVHAVLGLAELNPAPAEGEHEASNGRLDPWLVAQITPTAQEAAIASGLDMSLLGSAEIAELLTSTSLPDLSRLMLLAEQITAGIAVDAAALRPLAQHEDVRIAGLASLLLAGGGDADRLNAFVSTFSSLSPQDQNLWLPWLLDAVRQYRLHAAAPWLIEMLSALRDESASRSVVHALMLLDPQKHLATLKRTLGPNPSYRDRVHFGLMLLSLASNEDQPNAPALTEAFDFIRGQEELTRAIADVGKAMIAGNATAGSLIRLIDLSHLRSMEWAVHAAKKLSDAHAKAVYAHMLDTLEAAPASAERAAITTIAAARLYDVDPHGTLARLEQATDDSLVRQVILLGMLDSRAPLPDGAADRLKRAGFGRADSMATLLVAKHAEPAGSLSPTDLRKLGMIASGGGRLSEPLRAQAAWLYLKHTKQIDAGLGRMFAGAPTR